MEKKEKEMKKEFTISDKVKIVVGAAVLFVVFWYFKIANIGLVAVAVAVCILGYEQLKKAGHRNTEKEVAVLFIDTLLALLSVGANLRNVKWVTAEFGERLKVQEDDDVFGAGNKIRKRIIDNPCCNPFETTKEGKFTGEVWLLLQDVSYVNEESRRKVAMCLEQLKKEIQDGLPKFGFDPKREAKDLVRESFKQQK